MQSSFGELAWNHFKIYRGSTKRKLGPKNGHFTKSGDFKTDPSQKLTALKLTFHKNQ